MEASDVLDTSESVSSVFDDVQPDKSQQPIESHDEHGSVTPRSAPPAGPHAGIDSKTGQATVPPAGAGADQ